MRLRVGETHVGDVGQGQALPQKRLNQITPQGCDQTSSRCHAPSSPPRGRETHRARWYENGRRTKTNSPTIPPLGQHDHRANLHATPPADPPNAFSHLWAGLESRAVPAIIVAHGTRAAGRPPPVALHLARRARVARLPPPDLLRSDDNGNGHGGDGG